MSESTSETAAESSGYIGRIPVRNIWLLLLYASHLMRLQGSASILVESDLEDIPDLIARLLANEVTRRLQRNLNLGFRSQVADLTRVRGKIDVLETESRQLLSRGLVRCSFQTMTYDTPRNQLVRASLELMARLVGNKDLRLKCRGLANCLTGLGVGRMLAAPLRVKHERLGRNDRDDAFMVELAYLAFHLAIPTEESGSTPFASPEREEAWMRTLFEKAVVGFARSELAPSGWRVKGGAQLDWPTGDHSTGMSAILPGMVTDLIIDSPNGRRLVVDTKFTNILRENRFGTLQLKTDYLYQMYAYIRSQEENGAQWHSASGLLLHPAIGVSVREYARIQGHLFMFATVDLSRSAAEIRKELSDLLVWFDDQPSPYAMCGNRRNQRDCA